MKKSALRGFIAAWIGIAVIVLLVAVVNTTTLQAQRPPDLEGLHQRLLPLFESDGVVYTDADERTGRLVVGVVNRGLETALRARLNALGVSSAPVDVVVTEPIVQLDTLQDYVRPIVGGLQIRWDGYFCTLGFNAVRLGVAGFAVNSHCTTKQGGVSGTQYYQPLLQESVYLIGTEVADPAYKRNISGCPRGRVCRWSDSAYAERASGVVGNQGFIAMPNTTNTASSPIDGVRFQITSKGSSVVGHTVNKVGRTTGWTAGTVTNTCVNTGVSGTNIVQICQDFVSAGVGGGDSGSPVFAIVNAGQNEVQLRGILWGGNQSGTQFVYSPIANVERPDELGPISVCAPGFGC